MMKCYLVGASMILGAAGLLSAVEFGEKPDTPQLPESEYVVHDGTRPQPVKVKTAGAVTVAAPSDATVLFDGSGLEAWNGDWKVADGVLTASPGGFSTKESFGSCQLHLEWRIPAGRKVNGQGGGNSGVFLMGKYEVQVLESHTNKTYSDGQAGAMYGQYPPRVNASVPQGEWQSYDIIFEAPIYEKGKDVVPAYLTVLHNGVLLHHRKAYLGPTTHKKLSSYPKTHPDLGPIGLQWHGDPIQFRNIWIRGLGEYDQTGE